MNPITVCSKAGECPKARLGAHLVIFGHDPSRKVCRGAFTPQEPKYDCLCPKDAPGSPKQAAKPRTLAQAHGAFKGIQSELDRARWLRNMTQEEARKVSEAQI